MKLPALLFSDWHLTDNPADEYRWGLFEWLRETCAAERVKTLVFLGDLTEAKDNHSARLVNRMVEGWMGLALAHLSMDIVVMVGNHDWLLGGQEFFRFLQVVPGLRYVTKVTEDFCSEGPAAIYMPFTKNPHRDWAGMDLSHFSYAFIHQTAKGSRSSTGHVMDGEPLPSCLEKAAKVYSGDIHVPQVVGPVEYVGSPCHVYFGDRFKPRCVLLEHNGNAVDLHWETTRRLTLQGSPDQLWGQLEGLRAGDQVKLRVELAQSEVHEWARLRREVQGAFTEGGMNVHAVEMVLQRRGPGRKALRASPSRAVLPEDAVVRFVEDEGLTGDCLQAGLSVMEAT